MSSTPGSVTPVAIDIVSDVVCPWCYIGKRRLEAALAQRPDVAVDVRWHPFQLDPTIPESGVDRRRYLTKKFGGAERLAEINARLAEAGQAEGLDLAFDRITRSVNTLDAHRLLRWASDAGLQNETAEALFRAYFTQARDIGRRDVLVEIAEEVGLDHAAIAEALATDRDRERVQAEIASAVRIGVSGVPFFIFAQAFAVPGAQAADVLATAIDQALAEARNPTPAVLQA